MKKVFIYIVTLSVLLLSGCGWDGWDDGNHAEPPTTVYPQIDDCPCFSPDGNSIVYHHYHMKYILSSGVYNYDTDSTGIWFVDADGSNPRMFLQGGDLPDWSPDGEWIAFVCPAKNIWKIKSNGDSLTQLTSGRRTFFPDWSPDGTKIAYDQSIATAGHPSGIWIMNADGSNDHWVLHGNFPEWSPEGKKILYCGYLDPGTGGIYIADTNGSNIEPLLLEEELDSMDLRYPAWSPDGLKIAFSSQAMGKAPQIWVMNADGSNPQQLTTKGGITPAWSLCGEKIVYSQYDCWVYNPKENGTLWIMNADGTSKCQLTFGPNGQ